MANSTIVSEMFMVSDPELVLPDGLEWVATGLDNSEEEAVENAGSERWEWEWEWESDSDPTFEAQIMVGIGEAIQILHTQFLERCASAVPPELDEDERCDAHVVFVMHMRWFLSGELLANALQASIATAGGGRTLVGAKYQQLVLATRKYAKELMLFLICKNGVDLSKRARIADSAFVFFVLQALCCRVHGFFGDAVHSLFATETFSVHRPLELQDPAVWMLLRVAMHTNAFHALRVIKALQEYAPQALAAAGMLALLVRSSMASALLTQGNHNDAGLTPVCDALVWACDPHRRRTPVEIVLATRGGSLDFGAHSHAVVVQLQRIVRIWMIHDMCPSEEAHALRGVGVSTSKERECAMLKLAQSDLAHHCTEWIGMAAFVGAWLERQRPDYQHRLQHFPEVKSRESAQLWLGIWRAIARTLTMRWRAFARPRTRFVLAVWFFVNDQLHCFARPLKPPSALRAQGEGWVHACANELVEAMRSCATAACAWPSLPASKVAMRQAAGVAFDEQRWACRVLEGDETSAATLASVVATFKCVCADAQAARDVCVAQTPFRDTNAIGLVKFPTAPLVAYRPSYYTPSRHGVVAKLGNCRHPP